MSFARSFKILLPSIANSPNQILLVIACYLLLSFIIRFAYLLQMETLHQEFWSKIGYQNAKKNSSNRTISLLISCAICTSNQRIA